MEGGEEYPEGERPVDYPDDADKDDKGQDAEGRVGVGVDVGMSKVGGGGGVKLIKKAPKFSCQ